MAGSAEAIVGSMGPPRSQIIDEVQRLPEILNEVHRLIELKNTRFLLTGSSARKLRGGGVNLLGGRARVKHLHPLTCRELGEQFERVAPISSTEPRCVCGRRGWN